MFEQMNKTGRIQHSRFKWKEIFCWMWHLKGIFDLRVELGIYLLGNELLREPQASDVQKLTCYALDT